MERIQTLGPSPIHRRSFAGVLELDIEKLCGLFRKRLGRAPDLRTLAGIGQEIRRRSEVLGSQRLTALREVYREVRVRLRHGG